MNTTKQIENTTAKIIEFFNEFGYAAITTNNLAGEISETPGTTYNALMVLHESGLMWSHGKSLWKPVSQL